MTTTIDASRDGLLMLLLAVSAYTDLRDRRILNAFTYPALTAGLILGAAGNWHGFADTVGGAALAGLVLWPLCRSGGMGWGDLKLAAAAGALTGVRIAASSLVDGALLGGLAALLLVIRRGDLLATLRRTLAVPTAIARSVRRGGRPAFSAGSGATIPYGVAIALGTAIARWTGWPW